MSGGIDDDCRLHCLHRATDVFRLAEIAAEILAVATQGDELAERCQAALQFPADLSVLAEQQDFHEARPWYWRCIQSR